MARDCKAAVRLTAVLCVRVPLVVALGVAMASCRTAGDFGRERPSYFHDTIVPSIRISVGGLTGVRASAYPLTDAEAELRARAIVIVENEGPSAARLIDQVGVDYGLHEGSYQEHRRVEHSTGTADLDDSRYPRHPAILLGAVSEDLTLLYGFSAVAAVVYRSDKKRLKELRQGGDVPAHDVLDTTARVHENRAVVEDTILALHNRIDDYEIEIRRSILVHPDGHRESVHNAIGRLANAVSAFELKVRALSDPIGVRHHSDLLG